MNSRDIVRAQQLLLEEIRTAAFAAGYEAAKKQAIEECHTEEAATALCAVDDGCSPLEAAISALVRARKRVAAMQPPKEEHHGHG